MKCRACVLGLSFVVVVCIAESASAYYNSSLGRFVSRDPIGYRGSKGNLYEYVGGRPLGARDPAGLCPINIGIGSGPSGPPPLFPQREDCEEQLADVLAAGKPARKLCECAQSMGCLGGGCSSIKCAYCRGDADARYVYGPFTRDRIEVCIGKWNLIQNLGRSGQENVLLHEIYHAITICDRNKANRSRALRDFDEWAQLMAQVTTVSAACLTCMAEEAIARTCAYRQQNPDTDTTINTGLMIASCENIGACKNDELTVGTLLMDDLLEWVNNVARSECIRIDARCGL